MKYKLYIDSIWVLEFFFNLYTILLFRRLLRCTATHRRVFSVAFVASISQCIIIVIPVGKLYMRLLMAGIFAGMWMLHAAFGLEKKPLVNGVFVCIGLEFMVCAILVWVRKTMSIYREQFPDIVIDFLVLTVVYLLFCMLTTRIYQSKRNILYEVEIDCEGKKVIWKAFADTGNHLKDPVSGRPVVLIEEQSAADIAQLFTVEKYHVIPYQSVGRSGVLNAYEIPEIVIRNGYRQIRKEKVILAICKHGIEKNGPYQIILHPDLLV